MLYDSERTQGSTSTFFDWKLINTLGKTVWPIELQIKVN